MSAGKGDKPRNCFSEQFRNNYEAIKWTKKNTAQASQQETGKGTGNIQGTKNRIPKT